MPELNATNAQSTSSNMRSAIILGLGGTGLEVITMVKRMIVERFGNLDQLPIISFLHLDTASEQPQLTPTSVLGHDLGLTQRERITLRMPEIKDGGVSYLANRPTIREWFPPSLKIENNFALGAGAVRAYGRVAFAENAQQIEIALRECAGRVNHDNQRRFVTDRWGVTVDGGLDVYIVCSLLGGTGSGTFIDAAYLARHVLKEFHTNAQVMGFLVIGGGSSIDSINLANCYGALKELSYYSTRAQKLRDKRESAFSVQYPRMPRLESEALTPFSFCYLATNFNEQQAQFSKEALFELVAQNIFLEFTPGVAASKRGIRSNIVAYNFNDLDGRLQQAQSYLSFGISTIEFPALRVEDCLAYRLAGEALDYFSFRNAPPDSGLAQAVNRDLQDWGLDTERLLKSLVSDDAGHTLLKAAAELKHQKQAELQKYLSRPQRDQLLVYLKNHLDNARDDVRVTLDPKTRGAAIRQIEKKSEKVLGEVANHLKRRVAERISNPHIGVKNTLEFLQVLESRLLSFEKNFRTAETEQQKTVAKIAERESKAQGRVSANKHDATDGEMRTLVNEALAASLEVSQATILAYANRQARLLLTGETDEQGRWTGDCLLKQIKRLESQIAEFGLRLAQFTDEFAGQRERDESGREFWNGGKHAELRRNLTVGAYNSDVLVDPNEIETLYQSCIANPKDEYIRLKDEIERQLGQDGAPESIFWCVLEKPEQVKNLSVEISRSRFQPVRDTSIAKKIGALPQDEIERLIRDADRRSHVLLRFDNDSLSAADSQAGDLTSHRGKFHSIAKLATCPPQKDEEVNLVPSPSQQPSKLARAFQSQLTNIEHDTSLPDRYRLVFVREKAVFPLYCVQEVRALRVAYINEMRQHNAKPRETDCRVDFPDLFPPDPRETAMPQRVGRALTLGRAFKFVREDRDVRTEEPSVIYAYRDKHRRLNEIILGRDWNLAAQTLAERQIKKEVYYENAADVTTLELLEAALDQEGRRPVRLSEKEAASAQLDQYLKTLELAVPHGERDEQYQREAEFINRFRDKYGWLSISAQSDAQTQAEKNNRAGSPIPPTQPFSHLAPTQLVPDALQTDSPATALMPGVATEDDEASFRARVGIKLRRNGNSALPVEEITRLMEEGIEDYGLTVGTAKRLIDEAQQLANTKSVPQNIEKYRALCREIMEGGGNFDEDRATLDDKRRRWNLSVEQTRATEEEVRLELSRA
ncbi:MAG: tubulin-like doman-containing protein [Blastocatellales bacterium]